MIKYPMTVQGAKALEEEHAHLTKVVRPKLSQDIGTARELGDLKETPNTTLLVSSRVWSRRGSVISKAVCRMR